MRIWTLHPKYLDRAGLVALWREALLAQKVLRGETKGYRDHPQLIRFKQQSDPVAAIRAYLQRVYEDAERRGYHFDEEKIGFRRAAMPMTATRGQLLHEWEHLRRKLRKRDTAQYEAVLRVTEPEAHPLFAIVEGKVEEWEVGQLKEVGDGFRGTSAEDTTGQGQA